MINHEQLTEPVKHVVDIVSFATALGTLAQLLPPIAALLTIIWTGIRIYDRFKRKADSQKD
jgi:hypothetical protein